MNDKLSWLVSQFKEHYEEYIVEYVKNLKLINKYSIINNISLKQKMQN